MHQRNLIVLVGGSDLFSGMRGISKGTRIIQQAIANKADEIITVNYNYFLDFGRSLQKLHKQIINKRDYDKIIFYGYSKGGDVVLRLARLLQQTHQIDLLITIDIANGPWSIKLTGMCRAMCTGHKCLSDKTQLSVTLFWPAGILDWKCGD